MCTKETFERIMASWFWFVTSFYFTYAVAYVQVDLLRAGVYFLIFLISVVPAGKGLEKAFGSYT